MKNLVGKTLTKSVPFLGEKVTIRKLSVEQVQKIQALTTPNSGDEAPAEDKSMDVLLYVVQSSVEGAAELTEDELKQFPLDELSTLSTDILAFSGLGNAQKK